MVERQKPGTVRDAIFEVFKQERRPMAMDDIHAAVEKKVGAPVARSSVRSYLNLNVTNGVFERVERGTYRLKRGR